MNDLKAQFEKVVEFLSNELATLRTGRANPGLVTGLLVDSYGTPTPLKQVAQVTAPDATSIVIAPWDKSLLKAIEQAVGESDLGLKPVNDGQAIRLALPPLTEDRRLEMTKVVGEKLEAARVSVRNVRHDAITALEREGLSEDEVKRRKEELTKLANQYSGTLERLAKDKEQEILTV